MRLAIILFFAVAAGGYLLNLSYSGGLNDPLLKLQAFTTPIKHTDLRCENGVGVHIATRTEVRAGNLVELGRPSELVERSDLTIAFDNKKVSRTTNQLAQTALVEPKALLSVRLTDSVWVFSAGALKLVEGGQSDGQVDYVGILLQSNEASVAEAHRIARCIYNYRKQIELILPKRIHIDAHGNAVPVDIGWLARTFGSDVAGHEQGQHAMLITDD